MTIRELAVRLGLKTDPKGFKKAEAGIQRIKDSAISMGRLFMTGAVVYGFKRMIDVASDIEETANKFGAVFGNAGSSVQKQLDDISKRTGATGMQLQDMASNIGALVKPALGTAEAAGEMGASVAELALDISSFNNVTSEEALIALRSGLIGSAEPLQRFGVDVRVAALEQEALRQGITTSIQAMTEGQRVALRYAAIQRQLGTQGATGDATRTAHGFANASRNLWSALKEMVGIMMGFLLPAITKLVNKTRVIVDATQAWFKENKALIKQRVEKFLERVGRVISAVATFFGRIAKATRDWYNELGPTAKVFAKIAAIAAAIAVALLLPGVPMLLLIALIGLLIEDFEMWRKGGESVIGDIIQGFKNLVAYVENAVLGAIESIGAEFDSISDKAKDWVKENENAFAIIQSMALGFAAVVGVGLVKAYGAATASTLAFKLWTVKYYAVIAASWIKTQFLMRMAALKSAAAWLLSTAGLVLTALLLTIIVGTLIWLGSEFIKLIKGEENFFSTMHQGIKDLSEEWGGLGGAIGAMLDTALRYWLGFFGKSEDEIDTWIDNLTTTLETFWENVFVFWRQQFKDFFGWAGELFDTVAKAIGFDVDSPEGAAGGAARPGAASIIAGSGRIAATQGAGRGALINQGQQTNTFNVTARPGESDEDLARRLAEMVPPMIAREDDKRLKAAARDYALEAG